MLELMRRQGNTADVVELCLTVPAKLAARFERLLKDVIDLSTTGQFNPEGEELFDSPPAPPGVVLEGYRLRDGLTQAELAGKLGMKQHHVSEMETGKRTISKKTALKLGEIFNEKFKVFL